MQQQPANMDEQQVQALINQLQAQANNSSQQLINSPGLSIDPKGGGINNGMSTGGTTPVNNN